MTPSIDVVVIGGITRDLNIDKIKSTRWWSYGGGALYISYLLSKLGVKVGLVSCVDKDDFNILLNENFIDLKNTDITGVKYLDNATINFINLYNGKYRIQKAVKTNYKIGIDDIPIEYLCAKYAIVTPVLQEVDWSVIKYLYNYNIYTAVEMQGFVRRLDEYGNVYLKKTILPLNYVYILKGDLNETKVYFDSIDNKCIVRKMKRTKLKILAVTMSNEGSIVYDQIDDKTVKIYRLFPSKVDVVDATGAGDIYLAGLIYGLYSGFNVIKSSYLASGLATYSIKFRGVKIPLHRNIVNEVMRYVRHKIINI